MDPDETLAQLRSMVAEEDLEGEWSQDSANERLAEFAEKFAALDEWLSKGGYFPRGWFLASHKVQPYVTRPIRD